METKFYRFIYILFYYNRISCKKSNYIIKNIFESYIIEICYFFKEK